MSEDKLRGRVFIDFSPPSIKAGEAQGGLKSLREARQALQDYKWCPLCGREGDELELQKHHLKTRRKDKEETEEICRECHKSVHGLFTNTELRDERLGLDSVEGLLENERFRKALGHIKKVPPGAYMKMEQSKKRRRRR